VSEPATSVAPNPSTASPTELDARAAAKRLLDRYPVGSFGTGLISTVPSTLLLYFCTEALAMAPAIAGAIVFVPKLLSMVWDPFIGHVADRTVQRRRLLVAGACGVWLGFVATFSPPPLGAVGTSVWVACAYLVLTASLALYATPYIAFVAQVDVDRDVRTRLVGRRSMLASSGVLAGASAAPALVALAGGGRPGYATMAVVLAAACALAMAIPLSLVADRRRSGFVPSTPGRAAAARLLGNRPFRGLLVVFAIVQLATGALLAALPYVVTVVLGRGQAEIGVIMTVAIGASIVSSTPWARLPARVGERRAGVICLASSAAVAALFGVGLGASTPWSIVLMLAALLGLQTAGPQVLLYASAAHTAHESARDSEATLIGLWLAFDKVGISGGAALLALAFALTPVDRATTIPIFLVVVPPLLYAIAAVLAWFFHSAGPRHDGRT
jgi:Na+/melibiose symporter-like transporter